MDLRRSIIFIGLAVVSYMLILAWNDDYGQQASQQKALSPVNTYEQPVLNIEQDGGDASSEFSVPDADGSSAQFDNTQAQEISAISSTLKHINVKTDVLDLYIDLKGGNVISAKMPNYKVSLGSEESLALLESNHNYYYV